MNQEYAHDTPIYLASGHRHISASGGLYSKLRDCVATDASRCPWKKNGAPPLHRHGIRSSSDLASAENVG